jgi:5''-3'' exonuclease (including N-terminal domain of PolI)
VILIDGDIVAYRCAYKSTDDRAEYAAYSAGSYLSDLISDLYILIDDEPEYRVFLTGKGNFRHEYAVTAGYKENRKDKKKPEHLAVIRQHLIDEWKAIVSDEEEADDLIAIAATQQPSIIVSTDKDFDQVPGKHFNPNTGRLYDVSEEDAVKFLYEQILTGDRADNIMGIKGVGPVKAKKALADCVTERQMYDVCVEMYGDEERVIENGRLLYLRRKEGEIWNAPNAE